MSQRFRRPEGRSPDGYALRMNAGSLLRLTMYEILPLQVSVHVVGQARRCLQYGLRLHSAGS